MSARVEEKLRQGFSCIKIKIGAIDFEKEYELLQLVRQRFPADKITIRVDAIDNQYNLYAGGGLLTESNEATEWQETEAKLETMRKCIATKQM